MSPNKKKNKKKNVQQKFENSEAKLSKPKPPTKCPSKPSTSKKSENLHSVFSSEDLQFLKNVLKIKDLTSLSLVVGAVILNKLSLAQELVRQGCNVNENGPNQTTALMWAVQEKRTHIIEFLLSNGADPTAKNERGDNVLFIALENKLWDEQSFLDFWNHVKSIAFIDVDFTGRNGDNMVHIAVRRQWNELLNILIREKANVNAEDCKGTTPLMLACYFNNQDLVLSLLLAKANVLKEDKNKCSALCYAIFYVINKNSQAPHSVVDKLLDAMSSSKITFTNFFKTLFKSILHEPLKQKADHPLSSVKLSVIPYALRYKKEALKNLLQVAKSFKGEPFVMKQFFVILNDMLKYQERYFGTEATEAQVMESVFALGGADLCLIILKTHTFKEEPKCDLTSLAFLTLVTLCTGQTSKALSWLENKYQEVVPHHIEYLKHYLVEVTRDVETENEEKLIQFNDLLQKIKTENTKIKNLYINKTAASETLLAEAESLQDPKIPKVTRQKRAKALKAKITQIKSADLTQRLNKSKKHNPTSDAETFEVFEPKDLTFDMDKQYEIKSQQPYDSAWKQIWNLGDNSPFMKEFRETVNYLGSKLLHDRDDCDDMFNINIDPTTFSRKVELTINEDEFLNYDNVTTSMTDDWNEEEEEEEEVEEEVEEEEEPKQTKSEPIFCKNVKPKHQISKEDINEMMNYSIKYLTDLMNKIITAYKITWENDKRRDYDNQFESETEVPASSDMPFIMEKIEMAHIERIQRQFDSVTKMLQINAYNHIDACHIAISKLEEVLLGHEIRGITVQSEVTMQIIDLFQSNSKPAKENPLKHKTLFPKHIEELLLKTKTLHDFGEVDLMIFDKMYEEELMSDYSNSQYNASYLIKFLKSPKKSPSYEKVLKDKMNTMENAYHLIPSILTLCDDDEAAEEAIFMQKQEKERQAKMLAKLRTRQTLQESLSIIDKVKYPHKLFEYLNEIDNDTKTTCANVKSRWSNIINSLQLANDCKLLTNANIRVHNQNKNLQPFSSGGNFNPVVLGLDQKCNPLAVKKIDKDNSVCKVLKTLINPLLGLRNANLLHYYTCTYEDNNLILTTPLCEYNMGEYIMFIKQNPDMVVKHVDIVRQILNGLRFLHNRTDPIVHGNLKPSNIFIDVNGIVRIAEFGMYGALYTLIKAPNTSIIWFSRETFNIYRNTSTLICTCSSDIQVAGMLIHFVLTAGMHPYGETMQDILKNLVKGSPHLVTTDVDLKDLISWMLMFEPSERPIISQVLSHVSFWNSNRKWHFILTCCGISIHGTPIRIDVDELHIFIDSVASKENIKEEWITITTDRFPDLNYEPHNDSITGLLCFIGSYVINQTLIGRCSNCEFRNFILTVFPALPLSLYRILESSHWLNHSHLQPFTTSVNSYLA